MWVMYSPDRALYIRWSKRRPTFLQRWFWMTFFGFDFFEMPDEDALWGVSIRAADSVISHQEGMKEAVKK